ncbi:MAG: FG-GAP repeat protein [Candidatus Eisenbacteria bacterium]|nr:FG-GAP repeat protein [Candidatus Eisenbacteria bacterium]
MRQRLFLLLAAGTVALAGFAGCGDGEEGGSSGGGGGTGGDGGGLCPTASFTAPAEGAKLGAQDDADGDCSNGLQLDVTVATSAASGTTAALLADGQEVGTATAAGAVLKFSKVTLPSKASVELTVRFGGAAACDEVISVTTDCGAPGCEIGKPVLSPTHPKLNGVPVPEGGDRASAPGQQYQVAFEVTTDVDDGQPVTLTVDGKASTAVALAAAGIASFPGVTLTPDGDHKVQAVCKATGGESGASAEVTYPVDTMAPDLTNTTPDDGKFFGPTDDSDPVKSGLQFEVCGQTTAADALDLPASLGSGQNNFCVGIGTSTPVCAPAKTAGVGSANGGCVDLDCPGGAPFDLTVTLRDDAGNPTAKTIKGVRCASTLPSVQVIDPVDGTGADVTKHILAASMVQPRKDQDATKTGCQFTVSACTDVNGKGTLYAGVGTPVEVAGQKDIQAQAASAGDNCPASYPFVIKFVNADLPESAETAANALQTPTSLYVKVTDTSTAVGTSPTVQVWADCTAPTITEWTPNPLCGKLYQSASDVTQNLILGSTNSPVAVTITSSGTPQSYTEQSWALGFSSFGNVTFKQGTNDVVATTTEPVGNTGALKSPCSVTVGNPPIVTWTSPTLATALNAATDGNSGTAGWQGTLSVQTNVGGSGGTVTFKVNCGGTVTTLGTSNIDGAGVATLANATLPECASATITAETSNIAGKGVGTASLANKPVDTVVPGAPTGLAVAVKDRRATSFTLSWTAPADNGTSAVGGYQVRVSKVAITAGNFDAAEVVAFLGAPKAPGQAESLEANSRVIETNYYFAVAATDAAGNRGTVVATGPSKATFNQIVLKSGTTNEQIGIAIDASSSINGDAFTDLLVGGRNGYHLYIWLGSASGYGANPDVTITGVSGTRFGQGAAVVGDIDGDSLPDIAVGAPLEAGKGRVYIFKGRATWPAALAHTQADYVVDVDAAADSKFTGSVFGAIITPLGDIDQDGAADFAASAFIYGAGQGYVAIVRGVTSGNAFPATTTIPAAVGTRVIAVVGDPAVPKGWFGSRVVGLGPYYSGNHPAMVVSAPPAGLVYSFQGDTGLSGTILAANAKEKYTGVASYRTGQTLSNLGPVTAVTSLGVGAPASQSSAGGEARLFYGSAASLFTNSPVVITNSVAQSVGDNFSYALFGGGFSGSTVNVSLIGASGVDVGFSSIKLAGNPAKLYLAEGSKLGASGDIVSLADVVVDLPADWVGSSGQSGPIKDMNNDGYADIALGEQTNGAVSSYDGRVIVLW